MILCDHEILDLCNQGMVEGFDPDLINPASLNVRLGDLLLIESAQSRQLVQYPLHQHSEADPYEMKPGQFLLAHTIEKFSMPVFLAAEIKLTSSRGREGLDHALATYIDPGLTKTRLTLELKNNRQLWSQLLWPGRIIAQIKFERMSAVPTRSYALTGRYNGDATVQASRG